MLLSIELLICYAFELLKSGIHFNKRTASSKFEINLHITAHRMSSYFLLPP